MDEKDYKLMKYLYEEQSITRAAERLYITPPALTYRLQQIENQYKVKILTKQGKSIKFTPEGEFLVHFSQKMLLELTRVKDHINNIKNEIQGVLRLGVASSYAQYQIPQMLKSFIERYPNVQIHLQTGWGREIFQSIQNNEIQIGIVRGDYKWLGEKQLINLNIKLPQQILHKRIFVWHTKYKRMFGSDWYGSTRTDDVKEVSRKVSFG